MIVHRSALVERPVFHMFDLIEAAEHYPLFLPWCTGATIVSRDDEHVSADLRVHYAGLNFEVRTRNPKQRPGHMTIHLERGPFHRFEGEWTLRALGDTACKVDFTLDYEFANRVVTRIAGPVFDRMANAMVDAFVNRALVVPVVVPVVLPLVAPGAVQAIDPLPPPAAPIEQPLEPSPPLAAVAAVPAPTEPRAHSPEYSPEPAAPRAPDPA